MTFSKSVADNVTHLKQVLQTDKNFDVVYRPLRIADREMALFFVDGFTKDEVLLKLIQVWSAIKKEDMPEDAAAFSRQYLPYGEVNLVREEQDMVVQLLMGASCLFIDGYEECLIIDCRTYPARGVGEPEKDKVLRGSRDGFVETLIFNTALIRRRIRDPKLTMEVMTAGESSHTDIAICYMEGRQDQDLLDKINGRI